MGSEPCASFTSRCIDTGWVACGRSASTSRPRRRSPSCTPPTSCKCSEKGDRSHADPPCWISRLASRGRHSTGMLAEPKRSTEGWIVESEDVTPIRVGADARPIDLRPRRAVILAAGRSERMGRLTAGGSKALLRLGGLPLIERSIRRMHSIGVEDVIVVVGANALEFHRDLPEPAVDCGACGLTPAILEAQRRAAPDGDASLAGAVTRFAAEHTLAAVPLSHDAWWRDVDVPADMRAARRALR